MFLERQVEDSHICKQTDQKNIGFKSKAVVSNLWYVRNHKGFQNCQIFTNIRFKIKMASKNLLMGYYLFHLRGTRTKKCENHWSDAMFAYVYKRGKNDHLVTFTQIQSKSVIHRRYETCFLSMPRQRLLMYKM